MRQGAPVAWWPIMARSILVRARYLVLLLPAFALFSTLQIACSSSVSGTGQSNDDLTQEDRKPAAGTGADGAASGYHSGYGAYGSPYGYGYDYGSYDDETYGYYR
jgi:hypothetical protein